MKIIEGREFDSYWNVQRAYENDEATENKVKEIIAAVRKDGDKAVRHYASLFDRSSPQQLEVPLPEIKRAYEKLHSTSPELTDALKLAAQHIYRFSLIQKEQLSFFEYEMEDGLFTGQRVIPVQRAAVYAPGGRFPLISSLLMALIPAFSAAVEEVFLASPPDEDGLPNFKILAAAAIAAETAGVSITNTDSYNKKFRVFAIGGAQAAAAFTFGTESVPRADVIAGPGNRFVITAKRLLYGQIGIDFLAGPSDVLVIAGGDSKNSVKPGFIAADMLAQAEHDPDARARALVPDMEFARSICEQIEKQLNTLPTAAAARASLDNGGLIIVYQNMEEAVRIANTIAPEHLELQTCDNDSWIPLLKNYGSLFTGELCAEVLGDYSAGINHTLPTLGGARFTGGLSVRNYLKTVTTLRCTQGGGFEKTRKAAEILARAEGLEAHARSAASRKDP